MTKKYQRPTIALAFANDSDNHLPNIKLERNDLYDILRHKINTEKIEHISVSSLIDEFRLQENIVIFHYGGHAGSDYLLFENGKNTTKANIENLIHIIKRQSNLQLVFLNGCATVGQVQRLLDAGIKSVIATNVRIGDKIAVHFSKRFYTSLAKGRTLKTAFEDAVDFITTEHHFNRKNAIIQRGLKIHKERPPKIPWGLHYEDETVLDWKMPINKEGKHLTPLPAFNPNNFVGRTTSLETLHQNLQNNKTTVLLNGLGGIGKTSVARMYCYQHENDYDHFVWVSQTDTFENAWSNTTTLQHNLNIKRSDTPEQTIKNIFNTLNRLSGENLLILDNADNSLQPYLDALPTSWNILVTSREKMDQRFVVQELGVLSFAEAKVLFKQYFTKAAVTDTELERLCDEIGYHTLTLELLAKTLQESFTLNTITQLTEYLKNNRLDAEELQESIFTQHSKAEVEIYTHLLQAFTLATIAGDEKWLLLQFAVLPPIPHNANDILQWIQVDTPKPYGKALKILHKKGWLNRKDNTFTMHRMIQTLIRYQVPPTYERCKGLVDTFHNLLYLDQNKDNPIDKFKWVEYGLSLCNAIKEDKEQIGGLNNWTAGCFKNIGNYQQAEKHYKQAISIAETMEDINNMNAYNNNLANAYDNLGRYEEAVILLQTTLYSAKNNFGENHSNVATYQSNLANVYRNLGRYEEAAVLLQNALNSDLKNFDENHPEVAKKQSNLAAVYDNLGRYEEAVILFQNALSSNLKNFGENHPYVATLQSNLANTYDNLGRYEEAAILFQNALNSNLNNFGENHPYVATLQSNLANVYRNLGRYEEAAILSKTALNSDLKNFGKNHPTIATSQSSLANVYNDLGRYEEAAILLQNALNSDLKNFGQNHPEVAKKQSNLAAVYQKLGRYKEAATLLQNALNSDLKNFGQNHPTVARCQSNLAAVYHNLGRYEEAANLLESALKSDLKNFGKNHPEVAKKQSNLAIIYQKLGRYEEAAILLQNALKSDLKNFGQNHPEVATRQSNLANVYGDLERYEEAANLLESALKSDLKNFGKNHPSVATYQSNLAVVYQNLGRYEEAVILLQNALNSDLKNFGENHPNIAAHQSNLANVYRNLGRYEDAANLLESALKSDLKNFGKNHPSVATRQSNLATIYFETKKYKKAKKYYEKAFLIFENNFGTNHPNTKQLSQHLKMTEGALKLKSMGIDFFDYMKKIEEEKG